MMLAHIRPFWLPLCLVAPLAFTIMGCGGEAPRTTVTLVDNAIRLPASPGEPISLARVTTDDGYQIERMSLTGNYIYFATHLLYRMPKYGGELKVVDTKMDDWGLAANRTHVFWAHNTSQTSLQLEVSQYSAFGAPEGTFPIPPSSNLVSVFEGNDFYATDEALYVTAGHPQYLSLDRYPFDGTAPNKVLGAETGGTWPSWVVDTDRVYFTFCADEGVPSSCALESTPVSGGDTAMITPLPSPHHAVVAVDEEAVYLASRTEIVRVAKADAALTTIFAAMPTESISLRMVVDAQRLYCVVFGGSGPRVMSVPKTAPGTAVEIGHSSGLQTIFHAPPQDGPGIIRGFEQDEHNLFILPASSEIFMFPKDPS